MPLLQNNRGKGTREEKTPRRGDFEGEDV